MEKVWFHMEKAKLVSKPLATHFKLSSEQSLSSDEEKRDMQSVSYASIVGSIMNAMICTRPDLTHAAGTVISL